MVKKIYEGTKEERQRQADAVWRKNNRRDRKEYNKKYYKEHKEKMDEQAKTAQQKFRIVHHEELLIKNREYHTKNKEKRNAASRKYSLEHKEQDRLERIAIRKEVLEHYGGKCECCGEVTYEFLSIDHINGGGAKHRKEINRMIVPWLRKNNYPEGFRVLCFNCNQAMGIYGYCPHKKQ